jgi:hypothetical protein
MWRNMGRRYRDGLRDGRPGFDSRHGNIFLFSTAFSPALGAHAISYPMGTVGSFPGIKWPGRESCPSHLVSRSRMVGIHLHSLIRLLVIVLH